ncbi:MAG: hypothetical protein U0793_20880 [Gemmataceae bacterium]
MKPPEIEALEPLATVRVEHTHGLPHLEWAQGLTFRVPVSLLPTSRRPADDASKERPVDLESTAVKPSASTAEELRLRAAFTNRPPVSARLPFSYRLIPGRLRTFLASLVGRWKRRSQDRWAAFPGWPLDLSADLLADWASGRPSPWADGPTPVVLSHDLDSAEGLTNLVRHFLEAEERVGARSTNFVVPCAWPLDHGLLHEVRRRGHEVGIHGYDHSNRTAFMPERERASRILCGTSLARQYGACGYRAPSLLRTPELIESLSGHYAYDSSIPTSGGLFPTPNNGCASARPFRLGGLIELPLSMPRDGSLLFLGYRAPEILDLWKTCAQQIRRSGGVVVVLTHCEQRFSGAPAMRDAYSSFLDHLAGVGQYRFLSASEVVREAEKRLLEDVSQAA